MRHTIAENINVLSKFNAGDTVTISLYNISTESSVVLTSNSCNEIGATGVFKWNSSNITTAPTVFTEYLWIMDNGTYTQYGKIVLGGYPDDTLADTNELQTNQGNWLTATGFATQNPPSQNLDDYKADVSLLALEATTQQIKTIVEFLQHIEGGKWEIVGNQMIFYEDDNTTVVATFNLFDVDGNPAMENVFKRERV